MKIITRYEPLPLPTRDCDWSAVLDDYDGAADTSPPIGHGRTEAEAIADLMMEIEVHS